MNYTVLTKSIRTIPRIILRQRVNQPIQSTYSWVVSTVFIINVISFSSDFIVMFLSLERVAVISVLYMICISLFHRLKIRFFRINCLLKSVYTKYSLYRSYLFAFTSHWSVSFATVISGIADVNRTYLKLYQCN